LGEYRVQELGISEIAEEFGTPLYLYDGDEIERTYQALRNDLDKHIQMFYSLKPNPNVSIVSLLHRVGAGAEVCSLGEFKTALAAGVRPGDILFTGPGKSREELELLVASDVRAIICESFTELDRIDALSKAAGKRTPVLMRVNPAFGVQGGRLTMAGKPRQFGVDEEQLLDATDLAIRHPNTEILGIHVYTGTRILDPDVVVANTGASSIWRTRRPAPWVFPSSWSTSAAASDSRTSRARPIPMSK
jgi:diaminopimelate decarboxylase